LVARESPPDAARANAIATLSAASAPGEERRTGVGECRSDMGGTSLMCLQD
jgi:hypothetical protein